jgi:hypothetical protein
MSILNAIPNSPQADLHIDLISSLSEVHRCRFVCELKYTKTEMR